MLMYKYVTMLYSFFYVKENLKNHLQYKEGFVFPPSKVMSALPCFISWKPEWMTGGACQIETEEEKNQVKTDLQGSYLIIFLYFSLCLEFLFISAYLIYLGDAGNT